MPNSNNPSKPYAQIGLFDAHKTDSSAKTGVLHTDGASRGNPGASGIGVVLETGGRTYELSESIGTATNNVAEYTALIRGLEKALHVGVHDLTVFIDSELLVKQLSGEYKVKDQKLKALYGEALTLKNEFRRISIRHVRREKNTRADALSKKATGA